MTQVELSRILRVTPTTVNRWSKGGSIDEPGKQRLATFCDCTIPELESYLEGQIELTQLLQQEIGEGKREKRQILLALPRLLLEDLVEVVHVGFSLISDHLGKGTSPTGQAKQEETEVISWLMQQPGAVRKRIADLLNQSLPNTPSTVADPTSPPVFTIAQLIAANLPHFGSSQQEQAQIAAMATTTALKPDELQALLNGARPNQEQLIALASALRMPGSNQPVRLDDLQRAVDAEFRD